MSLMSQEYFARRLVAVYDYFHSSLFDLDHYGKKIMQAFLLFGSETPDNLNCFDTVHYSSEVRDKYLTHYGFKLRHKAIFVQDILAIVTSISIPKAIQDSFPDLTQDEWKAAIITAIKVADAFSPREMGKREPGWNVGREYFARKLWLIHDTFDYPDFDVANFNRRIMQAYLDVDWSKPDTKLGYELIEYGQTELSDLGSFAYGFKIKGKAIQVYNIMNYIESLPIPEKVAEAFPDLAINEWQGLMRMATMLVLAFSPSVHSGQT